MKIDIRLRGVESPDALRDHALGRIEQELGSLDDEIVAVAARITEVNGNEAGVDKQCEMTARGRRLGTVTVVYLSADARSAVDLAVEAVGRVATRNLDRPVRWTESRAW